MTNSKLETHQIWHENGVFAFGIKNPFAEYWLERRSITAKFGFVSKQTVHIELYRISGIEGHQSLIGRIADYGTIKVITRGTDIADIVMTVKHPDDVMLKITSAMNNQPSGRRYQDSL